MSPSENQAKDYRARIYERYASRFQDAPAAPDPAAARRWGRAYRHYLRGWLPSRPDAHILDLACGYGRLLQFYCDMGYTNVYGVDVSPEQVAHARKVTPQVTESDALDFLAEHPGRFDLISGLDIVEHFRKDEVLRFLDLCYAALRPGGRLILQTPNADSPWGTQHRYNDFTHEVIFNQNALSRLMNLTGFEAVVAREQGPIPWGYSLASTVRWCLWQLIRAGLLAWNLVETGDAGSGVLTRIFIISGQRGP
ncbi:MAG TPA: class I SAM-dependent methyltransferase [Planctomycetota bacterium]|nr:class I SAM-dependent methyltransferase [Planctomycetota bacterium]